MKSDEVYRVVSDYLSKKNHIIIVNSYFDPEIFGNFIISFKACEAEKSIVCDRGQLVLNDDLCGDTYLATIINSIYEIEADKLLAALDSTMRHIALT